MSKWSEFYQNRLNDVYTNYCREKYKPFIDVIRKEIFACNLRSKSPNLIRCLELGFGLGTITKILLESGTQNTGTSVLYSGIDNDEEMIQLSFKNLYAYRKYCNIIYGNIFLSDTLSGDVVHSHGLLEHYNDNDIRWILGMFEDSKQIHYVPSYKYETPSFGDERLLIPQEWKEITNMNIIEFNNGYDLIITNCEV